MEAGRPNRQKRYGLFSAFAEWRDAEVWRHQSPASGCGDALPPCVARDLSALSCFGAEMLVVMLRLPGLQKIAPTLLMEAEPEILSLHPVRGLSP